MLRSTLIFLLCLPFSLMAQTPADWWYFGNQSGIHFTTSGPVAEGSGQLNTQEGCATISDNSGDLLFYTDGISVWDQTHTVMPNGTGLLGNPSSTHSGIIVPRPGNATDYYVFTVDASGQSGDGLNYSRVDMNLNSGNGDVVTTEKNVSLVAQTSEKVTAIGKPGGYWVVTHEAETDKFDAVEVTSAGVNTTPVVSNTGVTTAGFGFGIKASPDGQKIAAVYFSTDSIFLYDFDASTGMVTFDKKIGSTMGSNIFYGLAFSPSNELLYMQAYSVGDVRQFDLTQVTSAAITASEVVIGQPVTGSPGAGGQLQLGPDGKLYCARRGGTWVSVINDPNTLGTACNWQDTAVILTTGATCWWGLPTFIQSFFSASFQVGDACFGDSTFFELDTIGVDSVFWNFDDPGSGSENTSDDFFPTHLYTDTGAYSVMLIAYSDTLVDTVYRNVFIYPRQTLELGPDTILCFGDTYYLDVSQPYASYRWSDSSTADTFAIWTDSTVYVTVYGVCDTLIDSISVEFDSIIFFELGPDTTFCEGNSLILDANITVTADAWWNTGDSIDSITVFQSGFYELNAINTCGPFRDTINVEVIPIVRVQLLPDDTINCFDNEIVLVRPQNDSITFMWSDSSDSKTYKVDTTELVWLMAFNECGSWQDTMNIIFNGEIQTELGEDTTICDEDSVLLVTNDSLATFIWNTGDLTDTLWSDVGLDFNYIVTVTLRDCQAIEQRRIIPDPDSCPPIDCELQISNVFTPDGDGINDQFKLISDCEVYRYNLYIYNRWGQLVFSSVNDSFGWDGFINGEKASRGVYYYVVEYQDPSDIDAGMKLYKGHLTLK
ncbi:MAG: T9SS type B sorting domain-containing protein [Flavobacteriales bacterium]|mgnify:FL=1|jgi:gliding motility-associated-like protein|nr:T9SS type B sorting domain-containing protein [Flavobacteriales bacterium]MBT6917332.1 T9SS type B sorting domain-containing protein [Flavobacteriales bacterium]